MNKDITLEEYTIKINAILAEKGKEFTKEELKPLWQSLQNMIWINYVNIWQKIILYWLLRFFML